MNKKERDRFVELLGEGALHPGEIVHAVDSLRARVAQLEAAQTPRSNAVAADAPDVMRKIPGTKFSHHRCNCGGNVFKKTAEGNYKCNSCPAVYEGDQRGEGEKPC